MKNANQMISTFWPNLHRVISNSNENICKENANIAKRIAQFSLSQYAFYIFWVYNFLGGRELWTVFYTGTQSFINMFSYSFGLKTLDTFVEF